MHTLCVRACWVLSRRHAALRRFGCPSSASPPVRGEGGTGAASLGFSCPAGRSLLLARGAASAVLRPPRRPFVVKGDGGKALCGMFRGAPRFETFLPRPRSARRPGILSCRLTGDLLGSSDALTTTHRYSVFGFRVHQPSAFPKRARKTRTCTE